MSGSYTIQLWKQPVSAGYVHDFWVLKDDSGNVIGQINGGAITASTIAGIPSIYTGTDTAVPGQYAVGANAWVVTGSTIQVAGVNGLILSEPNNQQTDNALSDFTNGSTPIETFTLSQTDAMARWQAALQFATIWNSANLSNGNYSNFAVSYGLLGGPNSNSIT